MHYGLNRYKFYFYNDKNGKRTIAAVSTYAGKTVKGYAKCNPADSFSLENGKRLAAARCNLKVANKRFNRATSKMISSFREFNEAQRRYEKMKKYQSDAKYAIELAELEIEEVLAAMKYTFDSP